MKNFFKNLLAGILGILVVTRLFYLFFAGIMMAYMGIAKPAGVPSLWIGYSIAAVFSMIAGFAIGWFSFKKKNTLYEIFKISKQNCLLSLMLAAALTLLLVILGDISFVGGNAAMTLNGNLVSLNAVTAILISGVSYFIMFYPFSSLCNYAWKNRKTKQYKKAKAWIILLAILVNPLFAVVSQTFSGLYLVSSQNAPCGVVITGFNDISPARDAGISVNETILRVGQTDIKTSRDFNLSNQKVTVLTDKGHYSVIPYFSEETKKFMLGITATTKMCKR